MKEFKSEGIFQTGKSFSEIIAKMGKGIVGVLVYNSSILNEGAEINPYVTDSKGGVRTLWLLDQLGIYGNDLAILYSDVCRDKIEYIVALIFAYDCTSQGKKNFDITDKTIYEAVFKKDRNIINGVVDKVKKDFPKFRTQSTAQESKFRRFINHFTKK